MSSRPQGEIPSPLKILKIKLNFEAISPPINIGVEMTKLLYHLKTAFAIYLKDRKIRDLAKTALTKINFSSYNKGD